MSFREVSTRHGIRSSNGQKVCNVGIPQQEGSIITAASNDGFNASVSKIIAALVEYEKKVRGILHKVERGDDRRSDGKPPAVDRREKERRSES